MYERTSKDRKKMKGCKHEDCVNSLVVELVPLKASLSNVCKYFGHIFRLFYAFRWFNYIRDMMCQIM